MNAIECKKVCKRYGEFELKDVSFSLPQGCVLGLVGENGAGKSTLIRMMLGACRPDSGSISVLGSEVSCGKAFDRRRQEIGVVLDEACLPEELSAVQVGNMMRGVYPNWDSQAFEGYRTRFSLPKDNAIKTYSRGMKMKLALAAAMSHHPTLLVLDEATGGLDPIVRDEILDLFNDFTREENHAILLSSHIVSDLEKICDYIVFLHKGEVMMAEEKDALDEKYAVLTLSEAEASALSPQAVLRIMRSRGAMHVLAYRDRIPAQMNAGRTSIEDIMLLLTKGEKQK